MVVRTRYVMETTGSTNRPQLHAIPANAKLATGLQKKGFVRRRLVLLLSCPQGRRGMWVVEVQGGGRQCRALVRRGALSAAVRPTAAGLALRLFREDGSGVEQPRWVHVGHDEAGGWGTTIRV